MRTGFPQACNFSQKIFRTNFFGFDLHRCYAITRADLKVVKIMQSYTEPPPHPRCNDKSPVQEKTFFAQTRFFENKNEKLLAENAHATCQQTFVFFLIIAMGGGGALY